MSPIEVGITGGIGAGKSIITKIFALLGVPFYDADSNAKWLMVNDKHLIDQITSLFGSESYLSDGSLNRKHLAQVAFKSEANTQQLNAVVHPAVGEHYKKWASRQSSPYILKEAALLFETQSYKQLNKIITVFAPVELRIERVQKRDAHRSRDQILSIIRSQMEDEEKMKLADFTIFNDDLQLVIPQVIKIDKVLRDGSV